MFEIKSAAKMTDRRGDESRRHSLLLVISHSLSALPRFYKTKRIAVKKMALFVLLSCFLSVSFHAQIMVSKLMGKETSQFGLGYGLFSYLDVPLANGNRSIHVEIVDLSFYPLKRENLFTTMAGMKGYLSIKLGYKYVLAKTKMGFTWFRLPAIAGLLMYRKARRPPMAMALPQLLKVGIRLPSERRAIPLILV